MKKFFYIIIGLCLPIITSAQLRNLDFENWDNPVDIQKPFDNSPTGWRCSNRWFGDVSEQFSPTFYRPIDTNAQHQQYALRMSVWYNYVKDAALQTAPINYRPGGLNGFYKYEDNLIHDGDNRIVDTAQVVVVLSKWNTILSQRDTVGLGVLQIHKANPHFKAFQVNINYSSAADPDSIAVFLDPSIIGRTIHTPYQHLDNGVCSFFTVDNLSLAGPSTGLQDLTSNMPLSVHPNPTTDMLQFETISGTVNIFDITGQCVSTLFLKEATSIDVTHLNRGVYFMVVNTERGVCTSKFVKR